MLSSTRRILPTSIGGGANIASRATSMMFSRGMTILSKESAEEFKKEVRLNIYNKIFKMILLVILVISSSSSSFSFLLLCY